MDYTELKDAVKVYMKDPMTSVIDQLTRIAEVQLVRDLPSRLLQKRYSFTGSIGLRNFALPTDFRRQMGMFMTTYSPPNEIFYALPQNMVFIGYAGQPKYYTVDNSGIVFERNLDYAHSFEMPYLQNLDIVATGTNSVADQYPDLYLNAILIEASDYRRDKEYIARWKERYTFSLQTAIDECSLEEARNVMSVQPWDTTRTAYSDFMSGR